MVTIKIKDKTTKEESKEVSINDVIFNQNEIVFEFSSGDTLPYKDFLFYENDYEIIVKIKEDR